MASQQQVFNTLTTATAGITLAELLAQYPTLSRRTAQRWIQRWITQGYLRAQGAGPSLRYFIQPEIQKVSRSWASILPV